MSKTYNDIEAVTRLLEEVRIYFFFCERKYLWDLYFCTERERFRAYGQNRERITVA